MLPGEETIAASRKKELWDVVCVCVWCAKRFVRFVSRHDVEAGTEKFRKLEARKGKPTTGARKERGG